MKISARVDGYTVENEVFNNIANKYAVNIIGDLKEEIKKKRNRVKKFKYFTIK